MLPHQFKRLMEFLRDSNEALRADFGTLQEVIENQVRATRDQTESEGEQSKRAAEMISRAIGSTDDDKGDDHAYREKNYRVQKILAFVTFLAFLATAIAAAGAIVYATIAKRQLDAMQVQTYISAESQLQASMEAVEQSIVTARQLQITQQQARATESAANTAAAQFEATQRPWVRLDATANGPLTWTGDNGMFHFLLSAKNMGPGIATHIAIDKEIYTFLKVNPNVEEKRFCDMVALRSDGPTLFPQELPYENDAPAYLSRETVRATQEKIMAQLHASEHRFPAYLIGCVAYSSTFSPYRYYTGVIYFIRPAYGTITFRPGENVDKLTLAAVTGQGTLAR
jgi:hypothetical protein